MKKKIGILAAIFLVLPSFGHSSTPRCESAKIELTAADMPNIKKVKGGFYEGTSFGIPLPYGCIAENEPMRLTIAGTQAAIDAEFHILRKWKSSDVLHPVPATLPSPNDHKPRYIRWLRIHASVPIRRNGVLPNLTLEFGDQVQPVVPSPNLISFNNSSNNFTVNTQSGAPFVFSREEPFGIFTLQASSKFQNPDTLICRPTRNPLSNSIVHNGPVYSSVLIRGHYVSSGSGLQNLHSPASCEIRLQFYKRSSAVRISHTMTWLGHSSYENSIDGLFFKYTDFNDALTNPTIGINGVTLPASSLLGPIVQTKKHPVSWLSFQTMNELRTISVRWSVENTPASFEIDSVSGPTLGLVDHQLPITLDSKSLTVSAIRDCKAQGVAACANFYRHYSPPSGMAKTHEFVIRAHQTNSPNKENVSLFTEHPLTYFADPRVSSASGQPIPWLPRVVGQNNLIEEAITASFDWITRQDLHSTLDTNLPWIYHGAHHWNYLVAKADSNFHREDRYWNNHDGVMGGTFWLQWLRTGDRKLLDHAEKNGRFRMDLSTFNGQNEPNTDVLGRGRRSGLQYHYSETPWGNPNYGFGGFVSEVDYLINYCYLLGYERACDQVERRKEMWQEFPLMKTVDVQASSMRSTMARLQELLLLARETDEGSPEEGVLTSKAIQVLNAIQSQFTSSTGKLNTPYSSPTHIDVKLAMAAEYNAITRPKVLQILYGVGQYYGIQGHKIGSNGSLWGVPSIFPMLAEFELEGDIDDPNGQSVLDKAIASVMDFARTVNLDEQTDHWYGVSAGGHFELAVDIREWITALAYISKYRDFKLRHTAAPMKMFEVPINRKHIAYALCDRDKNNLLSINAMIVGTPFLGTRFSCPSNLSVSECRTFKQEQFDLSYASDITDRISLYDATGALVSSDVFTHRLGEYPTYRSDAFVRVPSNCTHDTAYRVEVELSDNRDLALWLALESNQAKLIHSFGTQVGLGARPRGGTIWLRTEKSETPNPINIGIETGINGNYGSVEGKILAIEHGSAITPCRTPITGTEPSGHAIVEACQTDISPNALFGATTAASDNDIRRANVVNLGTGEGLSNLFASTIYEYFYLENYQHQLAAE